MIRKLPTTIDSCSKCPYRYGNTTLSTHGIISIPILSIICSLTNKKITFEHYIENFPEFCPLEIL